MGICFGLFVVLDSVFIHFIYLIFNQTKTFGVVLLVFSEQY